MDIVLNIIATVLQILIILMIVAMIASWLDVERRSSFTRGLYGILQPLMSPWSGILPSVGFFNMPFFAGVILLVVMLQLLKASNPGVVTGFLPFI